MSEHKVRMGIDVGGTHTKAVAIDNDTLEIIGKVQVPTTHDAAEGVAKGVVECFQRCLKDNNIAPEDVVFLAHSTTQATNALLEGDVANVGVIGVGGGGIGGLLAKKQSNVGDVPLVTGRFIKTYHRYVNSKKLTPEVAKTEIESLKKEGAQVIVASQAFGVDQPTYEQMIADTAHDMEMPCTAAYEMSKLYGLTVRTRTAVINASILPKMLETANSTESSVRKSGITAPLMIMRGDGGVMSADEMRRRPVLSMLSGPTASVVGALMYLRASVGIYFEVGGTSTNIGVIKNGRPTVKYASLGGYRTYVNSLDVRVLGVAGGSMVRASGHKLVDVGPRSAHIAGLDYAAFCNPEDIVDPKVEFISPKEGDPADYVAIVCSNGKRLTITNTCAANVLGLVDPQFFSYGNKEACVKAMTPLAEYLGLSVEDTAKQILTIACEKLVPVVNDLIAEYKLDQDQSVLVGCGGGAAALIPFIAQMMNIKYQIPQNADVISSIGVALAMVREVVERVIPNPTEEDIAKVRREAIESAIKLGADPDSIEAVVEIDSKMNRVRVTALGSTELHSKDMMQQCTEEEARRLAAESMGVEESAVQLAGNTDSMWVFNAERSEKGRLGAKTSMPLRVLDQKGFIKLQQSNGTIMNTTCGDTIEQLKKMWEKLSVYKADVLTYPDIYMVLGSHIIDLVGMTRIEQVTAVANSELNGVDAGEKVVLIGVENEF